MKNNPILKPAVCAAGILLLSGCYQTPEIDSQPDQAPKITVDAKSEYIVASKSADPVTFSISSNTPWQIESDSEAWCTVSPGASATSSRTKSGPRSQKQCISSSSRRVSLSIRLSLICLPRGRQYKYFYFQPGSFPNSRSSVPEQR